MELASADEVDVKMKHGLTCAGADIEYRAIAVLDAAQARDFSGGEMTAADDSSFLGGGFFQSANVFFGDDEYVRRGLRIEVFESVGDVILVNFFGRNFAGNDTAEQAVGHRDIQTQPNAGLKAASTRLPGRLKRLGVSRTGNVRATQGFSGKRFRGQECPCHSGFEEIY
jgi:hypothetical protein